MEVTIEKLQMIDGGHGWTVDLGTSDGNLRAYTVHVDNRRILTLFSYSHVITARWMREVLRCHRKSEKIIVGVTVDRQTRYEKKGTPDSRYELMTLCIGSHCLIVELPASYDVPDAELPLHPFFADPRVIAIGMNMKTVANKLFKDIEMRFSNIMELGEVAEEVLENGQMFDFRRYDLDKLGMAVMGRSWYVDRPEKVKWYPLHKWWGELSHEKVMYTVYDAYLCYSIGAKLMEMKSEKKGAGLAGKKSNKKKGIH